MVIFFNPTIMSKPEVWVKVESDNDEPSLFINNNAFVRHSINPNSKPSITERWLIGDEYYGRMVREGHFVPITDLNQADGITLELGWPSYEIDFGF